MAAQKSGPVSVAVIGYITSDVSLQGLLAIPAVLGQLVQVCVFVGGGGGMKDRGWEGEMRVGEGGLSTARACRGCQWSVGFLVGRQAMRQY
jgi:hypothetical protein